MVRFEETEDFDELKKLISNYVFEKTARNYPPFFISVVNVENNSLTDALSKFEKEKETTLEQVDDFNCGKFSGVICEFPVFDCCSVFGKDLVIFLK